MNTTNLWVFRTWSTRDIMSSAMDIHGAKRRKRNEFVTLPGYRQLGLVEPKLTAKEVEFVVEPITVDKNDYLAVNEILSMIFGCNNMSAHSGEKRISYDERAKMIRRIIKIRANDCHRRIWFLNLSEPLFKFPSIPIEIGYLKDLETLRVSWSVITEIPSSIGQLKNLKELYLGTNMLLMKLPEEIGDLVSLTRLDLSTTMIGSLPASIGRLRNLKDLDLSLTIRLTELPQEICKLDNLENLNLGESSIKSLPSVIVKLSKLKRLDVNKTKIRKLPKFIEKLSSLRYLNVYGTNIPQLTSEKTEEEYLLALLQRCPFLAEMDYGLPKQSTIFGAFDHGPENGNEKIAAALERNKARTILPFFATNLRPQTVPKLWPRMLENATKAFQRIGTLDAVHLLLMVGVDSFAEILRERSSRRRDDNNKSNCSTTEPATATRQQP